MNREIDHYPYHNLFYHIQQTQESGRYLNPNDISLPPGYQIEVFAQGLNTPINIVFTDEGDLLIGDAGMADGNAQVLRLSNGNIDVIASGFNVPLTGINYHRGDIYVSHKGTISVIRANGTREDIILGLPSDGDFYNNQVVFGFDNKMYFGQGTATNSGVVGLDNDWLYTYPYFHDFPSYYLLVKGVNYETPNVLIPAAGKTLTGGFNPFGVANIRDVKLVEGSLMANGCIYKCNLDGSNLEMLAWGLRNPVRLKFDGNNRLFATNQGMDERGSRPIANAPDELHLITAGSWYGWPDYADGEQVTQPRFTPEGGKQPESLLASIPSVPAKPVAIFPSGSGIMGFDFNYNLNFGPIGDAYVAKFGLVDRNKTNELMRSGVGHRITKVNMTNGEITTFAINKTGFPAYSASEGGFGRPTDVLFGPDGAMYIADFATTFTAGQQGYAPQTGVIWRVSKV